MGSNSEPIKPEDININMVEQTKSKGAGGGFSIAYPFFGYLAGIFVVTLFIISLINLLSFLSAELSQNISLSLNKNILNKDSVEDILWKLAKNNSETSAYHIFLEQQVVSAMYWFFASIILYVVIHSLVIIALMIYDRIRKSTEAKATVPAVKVDIDINTFLPPFFSILVMVVLAIVYSSIFTNYFIKDVQPDIIEISKSIKDLSEIIYDNLSTDEAFLKNVVNENMTECYKIINKNGNRVEKIGSMIFTMSIFNYYKNNSDMDPRHFEKIKSIFTTTQIRLRSVDPFSYLHYNRKTFIPNLYQSTEFNIRQVLDTNAKKNAVRQNVKNRLNDVNRKLVHMFTISSVRGDVRTYMATCFIIALFFSILIGLIYANQLSQIIASIVNAWHEWRKK